jgi:hypothetical protein
MGIDVGHERDRQVKILRIATEHVEAAQLFRMVPHRSRPTVRRTSRAIDTLIGAGDAEPR